jgi:hypothetical protein
MLRFLLLHQRHPSGTEKQHQRLTYLLRVPQVLAVQEPLQTHLLPVFA